MAGEAIEDVLTREQLKIFAKKTGRVALDELIKVGKEEFIKDNDRKQEDLNKRMDNFARNLNEKYRQNTTLYKEERNIQNKNKIEDRAGLTNAYRSPSGIYRTGNTLYISGTGGKDGDLNQDIWDDLIHLPTRNAHNTQKYKDVMEALKQNPDVSRLVGHSLSSAVINKINEEQPNRFATTTYATPTIKRRRKGKQDPRRLDLRNPNDIISMLDGYAETSDFEDWNALVAHTYKNFEELNFGLPQTAQFITDRRQVNYFPSGASIYSPKDNKNIRFYISGDANQYLDLSSVRLFATLQNRNGDRAKFLRPLGGLHAFFNRYRATVAGQMVQDIVEYNRHCELYKAFKSKEVNDMDDIEFSANPSWDSDYHKYANGLDNFLQLDSIEDGRVVGDPDKATSGKTSGAGTNGDPKAVINGYSDGDHNEWGRLGSRPTRHTLSGISGANGKVRLGHKPVCGLLESNYYLPLRVAPLELEFTVVSDGNEPIIVPQGDGITQTDRNGYYFQDGNTATGDDWVLTSCFIRADTITFDNTVDNSITSALLSGTSLKMVVPQYHTITQTFNTGGGEINMNIVKSASKLSHAFITLYRQPKTGLRYNYFRPDNYLHKRWNYFYNTMINSEINDGMNPNTNPEEVGQGFADSTRALSWQMQIGNKKYPEFECQSLSEAFYFLRRTVNLVNPEQNSLNISYNQYRNNKFVIAVSMEKMASVNFTSVNTKMGSLITFKLKGTEGALDPAEEVQEIFVHLVNESILELRSDGALVYD
eukprot:Skav236814  [mRNA]  locus=scaffold80:397159:400039:+ [translate_table: standard]